MSNEEGKASEDKEPDIGPGPGYLFQQVAVAAALPYFLAQEDTRLLPLIRLMLAVESKREPNFVTMSWPEGLNLLEYIIDLMVAQGNLVTSLKSQGLLEFRDKDMEDCANSLQAVERGAATLRQLFETLIGPAKSAK